MQKYYFIITLCLISLYGCAAEVKGKLIQSPLSSQQLTQAFKQQHASWKGVRYKTGGLSRKGVDCSGFVYRSYKDGVGVSIPRTTELQSQQGQQISKSELKVGDLIFFKTGSIFKSRHVGIYTGNNMFLHASTSKGVMKSSLNNPYWKETYWQARRVLK
ncbi:MAG: NlpC/P60 family protein [Gammaproteobacteria bacterium]|nr:NlpC/P60 family protein [Gammaproteobacteria bacterium]